MTSSITPITSASSTSADTAITGEEKVPEHGLAVLRDREAKALIGLGTDALNEACYAGDRLRAAIHAKTLKVTSAWLQNELAEVLTCTERAEHYLLMLGSNFEENTPPADDTDEDGSQSAR